MNTKSQSACAGLLLALGAMAAAASPTTAECAANAAEQWEVPRAVLAAVWVQEGGRVGHCSENTNQTRDCGPMQINTIHYGPLGVTEQSVRDDPCVNFDIAAKLLAGHYKATRSWAAAMVRYHSQTPHHAARYLSRLGGSISRVQRLCATLPPSACN